MNCILLGAICILLWKKASLGNVLHNSEEDKMLTETGQRKVEKREVYHVEGRVSRRRRYLNFPDGSTVDVVLCLTVSPVMPRNWYTFGITAGMGFPLPNSTLSLLTDDSSILFARRRDRRQLYAHIIELMESYGFDGVSCLNRLLCEASSRLTRPKGSFLEEFLHILFTSPHGDDAALLAEIGEHLSYDEANRVGRKARRERRARGGDRRGVCSSHYKNCSYSLLDFALADFARIDDYIPPDLS